MFNSFSWKGNIDLDVPQPYKHTALVKPTMEHNATVGKRAQFSAVSRRHIPPLQTRRSF